MLSFVCPCRRKLFKHYYVLIRERPLGVLHIMLCALGVLFDYTVLIGAFPFLHLLLGVESLQLIFQGVEALVKDLRALRGDLSLVVPQICIP